MIPLCFTFWYIGSEAFWHGGRSGGPLFVFCSFAFSVLGFALVWLLLGLVLLVCRPASRLERRLFSTDIRFSMRSLTGSTSI